MTGAHAAAPPMRPFSSSSSTSFSFASCRPFLLGATIVAMAACTEHKVIVTNPAPAGTTTPEEPEPETPPVTTPVDPQKSLDPLAVDLGEVDTGVDVPVDIPEGALGFNIVAECQPADFDPDAPFGIDRITDPKGVVVHDNFTPKGGTKPTSTAAFDTLATVSVPQSEAVSKTLGGKWKIRFGVSGSAKKIRVKAKVRVQSSGDGEFHGGKLDLHIHVPVGLKVDGAAVDATKADQDPGVKERVDTFYALTSQLLGFDRGEVVFHREKASLAELDGVNPLLEGFAVSAGEKDGTQALHILFTNTISQNGQPFAAGISPGIPGAATIYGRNVSGIIVATMADAQTDVLTMIHEAGHFFGLNHTTELDGESADPLSDTPECPSADIQSQQLQICPDRANVMFVAGAIDGPVSLSATQKRVYRGSPIYKAFPAGAKTTKSLTQQAPLAIRRSYRISGAALSPVERELSSGFCGLTRIDPNAIARRHGTANAIAQLQAASTDPDLVPFIRGRAAIALTSLTSASAP